MKNIINNIFELLASAFDNIPGLKKIKGYRSLIGFIGLAIVAILRQLGIGDPAVLSAVEYGFIGFTTLALNSKGRGENGIV